LHSRSCWPLGRKYICSLHVFLKSQSNQNDCAMKKIDCVQAKSTNLVSKIRISYSWLVLCVRN
jgi:hypothetical protein